MANLSNINGKFVVDTAGNIGVGTLIPRSDANTTNISIQSSGTARLFVNNTGASGKEYAIYSSANGDFGIFDYGAVSARLVINSSGNATFAGNVKLTDEKILGLRTSTNDYALQYRDLDFRLIGSADGTTQRKFSFGYYTSDNPAGTWNGKTYINSYTGNVGINVANPGFQSVDGYGQIGIEIKGAKESNQAPCLRLHETGSGKGSFELRSNRNTLTSGNYFAIAEGTDTFFAIRGDDEGGGVVTRGYVGIGTTSPEVKLDVQGSLLLNQWGYASGNLQEQGIFFRRGFTASNKYNSSILTYDHNGTGNTPEGISINGYDGVSICTGSNTRNERMRITSTGAISVGSTGTAYGAAGEVLTSNGNAAPSWQAAGGGGSAWPQEKFAEYTIDSTTSNILVATMNSTTWHGNYLGGCLKFTLSTADYIQVTYIPVSTFLSGANKWFFKGTEMTTKNNGSNPATLVFTFAGDLGTFGSTCTIKINRNQSTSTYTKVNVLVQAISNPNMFILN